MTVGCVKEIKEYEYRVGITPAGARAFVTHGHTVLIETGAGEGAGFPDAEYTAAGARICDNADEIWRESGMIVKVKEPLPPEYSKMRKGQILYTYLHLASSRTLTEAVLASECVSVAYETITVDGTLPLLKPMSEIAGRLSVQEGAKYLEKPFGGKGLLLSGVPGSRRAEVTILGAGVVGFNATKIAVGMGANVTVIDIDVKKLAILDDLYANRINTFLCTHAALERVLPATDLLIGAVLIPGAATPKLVGRRELALMGKGSVLVDVAVDQGGCVETSHPTYHNDPVFTVDGVLHYCVANMPAAVPITATEALTGATLPYGLLLADHGLDICQTNPALYAGVNTYNGALTCQPVADAFGMDCRDLSRLL